MRYHYRAGRPFRALDVWITKPERVSVLGNAGS
jgi:hypothetical protein